MADTVWIVLAFLLAAAWLLYGRLSLASARQMRMFADLLAREPGPAAGGAASLSVVVTARDEAEQIERTVRGLMAQGHADLEIVVVDDRSTDGTGEILERLAEEFSRTGGKSLTIVHNRTLAAGWLGKTHACWLGAARARRRWLLFLDGDVELVIPDLLARSVAHAERHALDHLALAPDLRPLGALQAGMTAVFGQLFLLGARSWEMDRDLRRGGSGVGAFNLVRRSAYERIGGHAALRLDPLDDVKLGRLLKRSGARQRIYYGLGLLRCPWNRGALNAIRGLEKNFFAGCDYSLGVALLVTTWLVAMNFGPAALAVHAWGAAAAGPAADAWRPAAAGTARLALWLPLAVQVAVLGAGYATQSRKAGYSAWIGLLHPLSIVMLIAALWNSAARVLIRGGVDWRGTFYPLAELRGGLVRSEDGGGGGV